MKVQRSLGTSIASLLLFLGICFGVAWLGAIVSPGIASADWYNALQKPEWTPPGWLFGPVWTILYTLMAVAMWLIWRKRTWVDAPAAYFWFSIQLALNFGWSWIFFYFHALGWAVFEILILVAAIGVTIKSFGRVSYWAGALLVPYFLWVVFASALTISIWWLN